MLTYANSETLRIGRKSYYERSSILESKINITYHELFIKTDEELDQWIEEVRQYIIEDWDERGTPPMIGQSIEDIKKGFRKLREYNIRGFIEKDDDGNENSNAFMKKMPLIQNRSRGHTQHPLQGFHENVP